MRISVVVPFRNEERHIGRCLAALDAQEAFGGDHEVIAVADRSSDGSSAIVRTFPGVRLLVSRPAGPYAARNLGAAYARGDVLVFTDADCEPCRDWLGRIAVEFHRPEVTVVLGGRAPGRDSFGLSLLSAYERAKDEYIFGGNRLHLYYGSTNNLAVRRDAFDEVGGFVERARGSDTLLVRRLVARGGPGTLVHLPAAQVRHLEIRNVSDYYRKAFVYGRSLRRLDGPSSERLLRTGDRLAVWRRAVGVEGYSTPRAAAMLCTLAAGACFWQAGGLSAALTWGRRREVSTWPGMRISEAEADADATR